MEIEKQEVLHTISSQEAVDMMERCKLEIVRLRCVVDQLTPKAEAYDTLTAVVRLLPKASRSHSIDLIWFLEKRIAELSPKPNPAPAHPSA